MATTKIVVAGSTVSDSQWEDFFRQIENGSIDSNIMQAILEHRNPFAFERNAHGHVVLTFTGLDLTGTEEIKRLEEADYDVGNCVRSCLRSIRDDSYDKHHRLVAGRVYKVALMPGRDIQRDGDRTTKALRRRGMDYYGYGKPLGGLIPRVREVFSDRDMEDFGIWYAAALHDPITDSEGRPSVFFAFRHDDGRQVNAHQDDSDSRWNDDGVFVFPIVAS